MSGQQKRGFRLPWNAERATEAGAGAATLEPHADDAGDEVHDDLGEGPFGLTDAAAMTTGAAPAAPDATDARAEAAMIETQSPTNPSTDAPGAAPTEPANADARSGSAWPDVDSVARAGTRPPIHALTAASVPRRDNPLVAGLVKAMREAALASRDETTGRLQDEAKARVETIRTRATSEVAELRKRADDDIAGIREWSKAEIARIRQETDERIDVRKGELEGETQRHAENVDHLVAGVESVVTSFEAEMDRFFERLLAENDPARLATLAEQAPSPPDLSGDGPAAIDMVFEPQAEEPVATTSPAATTTGMGSTWTDPGLDNAAAAAAEAAATEGLDLSSASDWPATTLAAARDDEPEMEPVAGSGQTRLLVSGLTSVAGISAFKGALGQLPGVHSVSVSSGERGVFIFAVSHEPEADLGSGVSGLPGFAARITDATSEGVTVVAHEPAA